MCDNNLNDNKLSDNGSSNMCWSDAITTILNSKPKSNKFILSKAKKDKDVDLNAKNEEQNVDIVDHNGDLKAINDRNVKRKKLLKRKRSDWETMNKLKPHINDKEKELMLASMATKGVVQLFNAVREQQITYKQKLNDKQLTDSKKDKELAKFNKYGFIDKLKHKNVIKKKDDQKNESNSSKEHVWQVLRDDFMVGAKMKDWDKASDDESDS